MAPDQKAAQDALRAAAAHVQHVNATPKEASTTVPDFVPMERPGSRLPGVPESPAGKPESGVKKPSSSPTEAPKATPKAEPEEEVKPDRRIEQLSKHKKELEQERETMRAELTELRGKLKESQQDSLVEKVATGDRPDSWEDWSEDKRTAWIATQTFHGRDEDTGVRLTTEEHQAIHAMLRDREIDKHIHGLSAEQREVVVGVVEGAPDLEPEEALLVAQLRAPKLFPQESVEQSERREIDAPEVPGTHSVTPPVASENRGQRANPMDDAREGFIQATHGGRSRAQKVALARMLTVSREQE